MSKGLGRAEKSILEHLNKAGEFEFAAILPAGWDHSTYFSFYRAVHSLERKGFVRLQKNWKGWRKVIVRPVH